jgi:hypothetical protein
MQITRIKTEIVGALLENSFKKTAWKATDVDLHYM